MHFVKSLALTLGLAASALSRNTMNQPAMSDTLAPMQCLASYLVMPGDTCNRIVQLHPNTLDLDQLLMWNPSIHQDCRNLQPNEIVCIRARMKNDCPSTMTTMTPQASMTMTMTN